MKILNDSIGQHYDEAVRMNKKKIITMVTLGTVSEIMPAKNMQEFMETRGKRGPYSRFPHLEGVVKDRWYISSRIKMINNPINGCTLVCNISIPMDDPDISIFLDDRGFMFQAMIDDNDNLHGFKVVPSFGG